MKRVILLALTLLLAGNAFAGVVDKKAALGGFDGFVERMGAGTRELGRGNTGTADTSAMPGAYWNPAILGFRQNFNYTLNLERRSLDRMGGSLGLEFKVIDEDDQTLGTATPFFSMMYLGFSYRATRKDAFGISLSLGYDNMDISEYYESNELVDGFTSPVSLNFGWLRQWNEKWSSSVVIRNISFSRNLSARWTRTPSTDNSVSSTEGVRPKVLQVGLGYRSKVFDKPVYAWMEAIDYQVADTLLVFDPQHHVWTGRVGFECEIIPAGTVRIGMDGLDAMLGLGYKFNVRIGKKKYLFDVNYALTYESSAGLFNPLSIGVRGFIP